MNKKELAELKTDLMNEYWTEELHHGLQKIDDDDARTIVESMDVADINYKVNIRTHQEDYIADYLEYLWEISETSFWNHVKATFNQHVGLLWSDNMFYFEKLCNYKIPSSMLSVVIEYIGSCDDKEKQDLELLGCIVKSQVENFSRLQEIQNIIHSLPVKSRDVANNRITKLIHKPCKYL